MADILCFSLLQQNQEVFLSDNNSTEESPCISFGTGNPTHMLHCSAEDNGRTYPKASPTFLSTEYPKE